jgi:hypothetical protein
VLRPLPRRWVEDALAEPERFRGRFHKFVRADVFDGALESHAQRCFQLNAFPIPLAAQCSQRSRVSAAVGSGARRSLGSSHPAWVGQRHGGTGKTWMVRPPRDRKARVSVKAETPSARCSGCVYRLVRIVGPDGHERVRANVPVRLALKRPVRGRARLAARRSGLLRRCPQHKLTELTESNSGSSVRTIRVAMPLVLPVAMMPSTVAIGVSIPSHAIV